MRIEIRKARKDYRCDYSGKHIKAGESYKRVNVPGTGVFHFSMKTPNKEIGKVIDKTFDRFLEDLGGEYAYFEYNNDIGF